MRVSIVLRSAAQSARLLKVPPWVRIELCEPETADPAPTRHLRSEIGLR